MRIAVFETIKNSIHFLNAIQESPVKIGLFFRLIWIVGKKGKKEKQIVDSPDFLDILNLVEANNFMDCS